MEVQNKKNADGSLEVVIKLSPLEQDFLKHDLEGEEGVIKWFSEGPSKNKVIQCRKRMFQQWIPVLRGEGKQIPSDDMQLCKMIQEHPNYKDRKARETV